MSVDIDQSWTARAACAKEAPDDLFVQGAAQRSAREICFSCTVRTECLADALDNRIQFGVWGGMTERERRALLRRSPEVGSWSELLEGLDGNDLDVLLGQRWGLGRNRRNVARAAGS
ncbi:MULTISPECIES: WhiB family transcriptional regulator [unclassified Pseudactinotalea]|uniref:WhiB family transcriptional regulator n=1 Tax=Micrococcales TaxID=85006 RepID=UPI003C7E0AC7